MRGTVSLTNPLASLWPQYRAAEDPKAFSWSTFLKTTTGKNMVMDFCTPQLFNFVPHEFMGYR